MSWLLGNRRITLVISHSCRKSRRLCSQSWASTSIRLSKMAWQVQRDWFYTLQRMPCLDKTMTTAFSYAQRTSSSSKIASFLKETCTDSRLLHWSTDSKANWWSLSKTANSTWVPCSAVNRTSSENRFSRRSKLWKLHVSSTARQTTTLTLQPFRLMLSKISTGLPWPNFTWATCTSSMNHSLNPTKAT